MSEDNEQTEKVAPQGSAEPTIGDLAKAIRGSSIVALKSALMLAQLDEGDPKRAALYNALWILLDPHAKTEVGQGSGAVSFAFTMTADVLGQLRTALTVRQMASETWGLTEAFLARVLTCLDEGTLTYDFDKVKRQV